MKCVCCEKESDILWTGYCPDCVAGKKFPVHSGHVWHRIVKRRNKKINDLKREISFLQKETSRGGQ